jgi:diguanylate cyclase (GGDEF)-like protein
MRRLAVWLGLLCLWASPSWAAATAPLTSLLQVHNLSNEQAGQGLPVALAATVTYYDPALMGLWVQDGGQAIYVEALSKLNVVPGDRVLVRGFTQNSFRPIVMSDNVTLLDHGKLPAAAPASFADLISGDHDCLRVVVRARVRAADLGKYAAQRILDLQLLMDGGYVEVLVRNGDESALNGLLDADVEVTGVVAGRFDGKRQLTGAALFVNSLDDIRVLKRPGVSPESLPVTPMDRILSGYSVQDLSRRVRVEGTITYYKSGSSVVLQNGAKSLLLMTQTQQPLHIGDFADASGFPDSSLGYLTLTHSEIRDSGRSAPVAPSAVPLTDLRTGHEAFDLVSTEGALLMAVREASEDEYVLVSDGHLFTALYRHPSGVHLNQLPPMKEIEPGSTVRITGICMFYGSDPFNGSKDVDMLLRSPEDVTVIAPPSMLSVKNLIRLTGFLLVVVIVACLWGLALSRKVSRQVRAMARRVEAEAALEKRRSQILEDINGTRPLAEILSEITELIAFKLEGAHCWCELETGMRVGSCSPATDGLQILWHEIVSRSGPPHGKVFAAPNRPARARNDAHGDAQNDAMEALAIGAWLATVAIETRGLYSDLVRRSEHDLLTNAYNRFSLETQLDALIEQAGIAGRLFGLVYIDLDDFKRVNDQYGHQVGDQYLQQSALRMQHQLRPTDLLARIGGDEFAALITGVQSRAEAEEIAHRLERCFSSSFDLGQCVLRGSASMGFAVYPQDGTTRDALLSAADAAMYVAKNAKRGAAVRTS